MNKRIDKKDLITLDTNGRACEICDKHMHDHDSGFVVDCCFCYCRCEFRSESYFESGRIHCADCQQMTFSIEVSDY